MKKPVKFDLGALTKIELNICLIVGLNVPLYDPIKE